MTSGRCIRCGRETDVEYGSDGMAYCSSCIFYGLNKPCFRCRMYLPSTELQQYRGQWVCPYCLMDMRDEDRRLEGRAAGGERGEGIYGGETCERCGRQVSVLYEFNGRRLCASCLEDAKREWKEVGGEKPPLSPLRVTEEMKAGERRGSFIEWFIGNLLALLGLRARRKAAGAEIVALRKPAPRIPASGRRGATMAQETQAAKPMSEGISQRAKREKRGAKKSQDVTFAQYVPEKSEGAQEKGKKEAKKKKFVEYKEE